MATKPKWIRQSNLNIQSFFCWSNKYICVLDQIQEGVINIGVQLYINSNRSQLTKQAKLLSIVNKYQEYSGNQ